jgi:hypothetical protein
MVCLRREFGTVVTCDCSLLLLGLSPVPIDVHSSGALSAYGHSGVNSCEREGMCVRESVCMCVCVCVRERER